MSFSRLQYDTCAYDKTLSESMGTGEYMTKDLANTQKDCFMPWSHLISDKRGVAVSANYPLIDVDSELLGLHRHASHCRKQPDNSFAINSPLNDCTNSFMQSEDTKITNPPCTLRSTGWNRWEWLCENPQNKAIIPFQTEVQNKLIVRDNHVPCIPTPNTSTDLLPNANQDCMTDLPNAFASPEINDKTPPYLHWRSCCEIPYL